MHKRFFENLRKVFYIPVSYPLTADLEFSGLIIEAMARESIDTVTPAFYESTLKGKYSRDEMSIKMFEILRQTTHYDIGYICNVGNTSSVPRELIYNGGNAVSYYESKRSVMEKAVEELRAQFEE